MTDDDVVFEKPSFPKKPAELDKKTIDISIGHHPEVRYQGTRRKQGEQWVSEYSFAHEKLRPALEEYVRENNLPYVLRFWDAGDHPDWGLRSGVQKGAGYILYDRLAAMYKNKNLSPPVAVALALHNNASKNTKYGGTMMIFRRDKDEQGDFDDTEGKRLATLLCNSFADAFSSMTDRGPQGDRGEWVDRDLDFTRWGFRYRAVPVIVEFGFMSNDDDRAVITNEETPKKYAKAIFDGLRAYFQGEGVQEK